MGLETLAIASIATTLIGTGVSAIGQAQQGQAQADAAQYRAAVARNNQIIVNRAANDARQRGELEANLRRLAARRQQGAQRAGFAGGGVLVDQDSAQQVVEDTAAVGELDALTIKSNAEREALGFEARGMNFGATAGLQESSAAGAEQAGLLRAGGTLLTGIGSVSNKWYSFKNQGGFSSSGSSSSSPIY